MATFSDLVVNRWGARFMGRHIPCAIGRSGIGRKQREGDGVTPAGTFKILDFYSRPDRERSIGKPILLAYVWSDDPADPNYNSLQTNNPYPFTHEKMRRADPMYDMVGDIDFNRRETQSGRGSAIFLHVWRKPRHPTEGCIAFSKQNLRFILDRWSDRSRVITQP